jgi:2,4-dienoyl-CoA reductase-like NADH-dependent reductase (Old Yellow Enzyme family)
MNECAKTEDVSLFDSLALRNVTLPNRMIRSATYEGMGDSRGFPGAELAELYGELARGGVGTLITGFVFVAQAGRAMQPQQCGIDTNDKVEAWRKIVAQVKEASPDVRLFMQLAHAGRQTRREATGFPVPGASSRPCSYFRQPVTELDAPGIETIATEFGDAARRAQQAGFDGVQIHGAHGYLVHQFLSPWTNRRRDRWADRPRFLEEIIRKIKTCCGARYPLLVKLSAADDNTPGLRVEDTMATVKRLELLGIDAVEISYGTMEYALNIIRGHCPVNLVLKVNPLFNRMPRLVLAFWKRFGLKRYLARLIPFSENYNVESAARIKAATSLPVVPVGGIRTKESMLSCLSRHGLDAVALCRPLICEPDLPTKLLHGLWERSACTHCNLCTVYCDAPRPLRCYRELKEKDHDGPEP